MECSRCGSAAINPQAHGRQAEKDLDLCDVCYWRKRAEGNFILVSRTQKVVVQCPCCAEMIEVEVE